MNRKITKGVIGLMLVLTMVWGVFSVNVEATDVGSAAPDFTLKTHDGKSFTLSKAEGKKGVVLVFFATWCAPCMREVPHIKHLVHETMDKDILVLGVNDQGKAEMDRFIKDKDINYRVLLDETSKAAIAYKVQFIPTIIGIDAEGIVRYRSNGIPKDIKAFTALLTKGVKKEAAAAPKKEGTAMLKKIGNEFDYVKDGVSFISKETLQKWIAGPEKPLVIDVLSPEWYAKAHVKGAINIPLSTIKEKAAELDKDQVIVTYCGSFKCHASTEAAKILTDLGFSKVYDYGGGIKDWKESGLPVEPQS